MNATVNTLADLISRYGGEASLHDVLELEARREGYIRPTARTSLRETLVGIIRGRARAVGGEA